MKILSMPIILLAALLLAMATPLAGTTAHAAAPGTSSGSFQFANSVVNDSRSAGPNTFYTLTNTITTTGTFVGTLVCHERQLVKANGAAESHDRCVFTGRVDGHSGTAVLGIQSSGAADGTSHGHFAVRSGGTGGLAGLRGQGTFAGKADGSGTYSGKFHFE